jgi:hypothetical protein
MARTENSHVLEVNPYVLYRCIRDFYCDDFEVLCVCVSDFLCGAGTVVCVGECECVSERLRKVHFHEKCYTVSVGVRLEIKCVVNSVCSCWKIGKK